MFLYFSFVIFINLYFCIIFIPLCSNCPSVYESGKSSQKATVPRKGAAALSAPPLDTVMAAEFGTRYTKTLCIVQIDTYTITKIQYTIHTRQFQVCNLAQLFNKISLTFLIILLSQILFKFSSNFLKFSKTFLKLLINLKFFKIYNSFYKFVQSLPKILKILFCFEDPKSLRLHYFTYYLHKKFTLYTNELTNYTRT